MKFRDYIKASEAKSIPTGEIIAYHGGAKNLVLGWKIDPKAKYGGFPFFATSSKKLACYYGDWVHQVAFTLKKPLIIDAKGDRWNSIKGGFSTDEIGFLAFEKGYDGVVINDLFEDYGYISTVYMVFDTSKIKILGSALVHKGYGGNKFVDFETEGGQSHKKYSKYILDIVYPGVPVNAFEAF